MGDDAIAKKKATIIGVSSLLLVAAVVGAVTYGVTHGEEASAAADGGASGNKVQTSSKSVQAMCQPTDYKETCEKSLSGAKNTSDPKELMKVAFQATVDSIGEALKNSALLKEAAKNPRTAKALENCKDYLDNSIDDIKRSFDKIGTFDISKFDDYIIQIRTWLSAAITYQQTCLDEFDGVDDETGNKMRQVLKNTSELSSNGLAMISELSQILVSLQIPGLSRKLLSVNNKDYIPEFVPAAARALLQDSPAPNVVVAQDGSGQFKTISEAVATIPKKNEKSFVILIKAGVYNEYVEIPKNINNVVLIGEGTLKTKITGNKNFIDGTGTYRTATVGEFNFSSLTTTILVELLLFPISFFFF